MLEVLPDFARLLGLNSLLQSNDFFHVLVEIGRAFPILSQVIRANVTGQIASLLTHLEHLVLLIVVHVLVVSQFAYEELQRACSGQMDVVYRWLRHLYHTTVEVTLKQ